MCFTTLLIRYKTLAERDYRCAADHVYLLEFSRTHRIDKNDNIGTTGFTT